MSNDLLMLRGEQDGTYNLAVGEPVFLQNSAFWCIQSDAIFMADPRYPAYGGDPALIEQIRGSFKFCKKHVVVTNGAKQALLAAFYAYRSRPLQCRSEVEHLAPFWPSYPTLAKLSGMTFTQLAEHGKSLGWQKQLKVITSPNNPDGSETLKTCDVWDGAYAHWLYGYKAVPQHEVGVFSAAKILGLSGARVGILTTDNDDLAELAREYVEKSTSGVSNESQSRLRVALHEMNADKPRVAACYAAARRKLLKNGEIFGNIIGKFCSKIEGVPVSGRGMFVWFEAVKDKMDLALKNGGIRAIPGQACGVLAVDGMSWYRMSMGQENDYTEKALLRLRTELT